MSRHEPTAVAGPIHPIVEDWPRFRGVAHRHGLGEIIYAIEGVVSVATDEGTWVVPPDRAVWIPAGVEHTTRSHGPVRFRALFVSPSAEESFPPRPCVVEVSALLREAIRRFTELPEGERETDFAGCLTRLILAELRFTAVPSLELPRPRDPRLIALCDAFVDAPAQEIPLEAAAARCGVSRATFMRLFQTETGTSWGRWCRHARLFAGLTRLAEGHSVLAAALDCGYQSPSAFAAAFRATLGRAPREWFGARGRGIDVAFVGALPDPIPLGDRPAIGLRPMKTDLRPDMAKLIGDVSPKGLEPLSMAVAAPHGRPVLDEDRVPISPSVW